MALYARIITPIDLAHPDRMEKALDTAADLAKRYEVPLTLVGVTAPQPGAVAHTSAEYEEKLAAFARAEGDKRDVAMESRAVTTPDPVRDLHETLTREAEALGADLIVMASHVPGVRDHFLASNAGYVASHSAVSVFVVR
ncbi:MAG: universal stress protein [Alphaproteobacteria bacterium]|nr:universal stress protein [Alphaproteobacteria bacterium]